MHIKKTILFLSILLAFSSCKTYQVMHYKDGGVEKLDAKNYKVYIHTAKNLYLVTKPAISPTGITGDISEVKDQAEAEEIKNPTSPSLIKKHRHDLNIFTRTQIADSVSNITVKKGDIY